MNKQKKFEKIKNEVLNLESSPLFEYRQTNNYKPVIGEGSLDAEVMFVGEAPGKNEAEQGRPFIGSAGKILDALIKTAGLERKDIYITSILFDRPPNNRNPKKEEIDAYKPYLKELIKLIAPKMIVTLGNFAIKSLSKEFYFSDKFDSLRTNHGKVIETKVNEQKIKIFPAYHPAAVLYNRNLEKELTNDFIRLKQLL